MASRINFDSGDEEASIDMTPMLDVVFIMLIFFIVSTTFIRDEGVEINTPTAENSQRQAGEGLVVVLDAKGQIWLDKKEFSLAQLSLQLVPKLLDKTRPVLIKVDQATDTGRLIDILDAIKSLGVEKVAVATQPPSQ